MDKLLSIIVPSYNMEKYLPKCLGSLIVDDSTLLQKLDVIVVNDGSKDQTSGIAHEFEKNYSEVFRVIDKTNGNYGSCINAALPVAKGQFVKILDADDTFDTVAFTKYLKIVSTLPIDTDMVMNDYNWVTETGALTATIRYDLPTDKSFSADLLVANKCNMAMHAVAYRKDMLMSIAYQQTEGISYTDTEWFYLPPAFAKSIRYINQSVYRYLFGRSGQTMEYETWVKNEWMINKVFDRMLIQYDSISSSSCDKVYLEAQLQRIFAALLDLHLNETRCAEFKRYLNSLHFISSKYPFLYLIIKDCVLFARTPFRFHYLEFMMRHPRTANNVLSFIRYYNRYRSKV